MNIEHLNSFKKKVKDQYLALKNVREKESQIQGLSENQENANSMGIIDRLFFKTALFFADKGLKLAQRKRVIAKQLLADEKIRSQICSSIGKFATNESDEELLIANIVESITNSPLIDEYSIPFDDELFGAICDEIFITGVNSYCQKGKS